MAASVDRNCTHLAGEYFVAAELYRRGYSVAITLGNAKAIYLYAEKGTQSINVQVKAIRDRKSTGWPVMRDRVLPNILYIFVCLNQPGTPPDYFICTSEETRGNVKQYKTRGTVPANALRSTKYRERWDKLEAALRGPASP
jgi:hypothetical protein